MQNRRHAENVEYWQQFRGFHDSTYIPKMETITYHGWRALRLRTSAVELILPTDIGPRVLHCGLLSNGENLFALMDKELGGRDESTWQIRGGHRLWIAPEHEFRTYRPDNRPIEETHTPTATAVTLQEPVDPATGLGKQIRIEVLDPNSFKVVHSIRNEGAWPVPFSVWGLSVMAHGGYAVLPLPPKGTHPEDLLPETTLVPWPYTDFSLPAWEFHKEFIGFDSAQNQIPQKLGMGCVPGWMAYWQPAGTFVKYTELQTEAPYPDKGSSVEIFGCDWMVELETLSPLEVVEPGETLQHIEYWGVLEDLRKPATDEAFANNLAPAVRTWLRSLGV